MILDGRYAQQQLFTKLVEEARLLPVKPTLAAIQVGDNPASSLYIKLKRKTLEKLGFGFKHIKLATEISSSELTHEIEKLNLDPTVNGILLQLPLPAHFNSRDFLDQIAPQKDVDCLTSINLGKFFDGEGVVMPATPLGVIRLLDFYNIPVAGQNICVAGRSNLVGKPLAVGLTGRDATVTLCHSKSKDLRSLTKHADIVITAIGKAAMFTSEYFTQGQTVIDIGTSLNAENKIAGDVDYPNVMTVVENLTPVPGGVGPMTIYGLVENLVKLTKLQ